MKTLYRILPVTTALLILCSSLSIAQNTSKSDAQKTRQEYKDAILKLVESQKFVVKANRLQDRYFNEFNVNSTVNFVKIDSSEAVVQFGFNGFIGRNGVGGLTAEGRLSGYKVIPGRSESDPVRVRFYTSTSEAGHLTFFITIYNDGRAQAAVSDMYGSRLTFTGELATLDGARIYQGTTLYY